MRRLFYVTDELEDAQSISNKVNQLGVGKDHFFILSRDAEGIKRCHLHGGETLEGTQLLAAERRTGMLSVVSIITSIGGVAMCIDLLEGSSFLPFVIVLFAFFITILVSLKWSGRSFDAYFGHIFNKYLDAGSVVVIIDVDKKSKRHVEAVMEQHPKARFIADSSNVSSPIPE